MYFNDINILIQAVTHKSYDSKNNFEKLEFLGDRVLGLAISNKLIKLYPNEKVGMLVIYCLDNEVNLDQLSLETIREFMPEVDSEIFERLKPESVMEKRQHIGSTGLTSLKQQLDYWNGWIEKSS